MDKPTHNPATPAPPNIPTPDPNPSDNYTTSGPPPEYQQHQNAHLNAQPTGTSMPKYGGPSPHSPPPPQNYGGYVPPQSYPLQTGGPQNFQPYGTPLPSLGPHPAPVECPECHARGVTAVEYSSGGFTHALAALPGSERMAMFEILLTEPVSRSLSAQLGRPMIHSLAVPV
ncbi:LITAF-like zinc finger protein [Colletotrichum simmondsii]|uniref:LITAF-like zinc finger protein n=1 Tax=Colletotrichum simmondsii TaxID=703756 RepID=A0A135TJU5_9PEZI|nr:LITAF-like zinc finger protein [Colletotrichum simmondsii]